MNRLHPIRSRLQRALAPPGASRWVLLLVFWISLALAEHQIDLTREIIDWMGEKYGSDAAQRVVDWKELMQRDRELPEDQKLERVNDFFNKMTYSSDYKLWGKADYWATPFEALGINAADCEDYAISKYLTLREMGVPEEKMRIMYVKALELNQAHMVLTYYPKPDAIPLVLDNLNPRILTANRRADLAPVYSFNAEGLWLAKNLGRGKRVGNSSRLSLWQEYKQRLAKELRK